MGGYDDDALHELNLKIFEYNAVQADSSLFPCSIFVITKMLSLLPFVNTAVKMDS